MSAAQPLPIAAGATLDITWDWSAWLADGETITAREVTAVSPLSKGADNSAAGVITAWVTVPAAAAVGTALIARCQVTTSAGRVDLRKFLLQVADR
jgi:hypothetical protein